MNTGEKKTFKWWNVNKIDSIGNLINHLIDKKSYRKDSIYLFYAIHSYYYSFFHWLTFFLLLFDDLPVVCKYLLHILFFVLSMLFVTIFFFYRFMVVARWLPFSFLLLLLLLCYVGVMCVCLFVFFCIFACNFSFTLIYHNNQLIS